MLLRQANKYGAIKVRPTLHQSFVTDRRRDRRYSRELTDPALDIIGVGKRVAIAAL
jgi:hypothetical protein